MAALGAAVTATVTRKMSQEVGIRVVIFYFFLIGSVLTLALSMALGFKYPDCGSNDTIYIIVAAFCGFCGQLLATKALSMEKASVVSLVRTIGIAYSFIFQQHLFSQGLLIIKAGVSKFLHFSIYGEHDIVFTIPTLFVEFS